METIPAKTIVSRVQKPSAWFGAEYNMNIYRGCTHGCIYCDSRSDCYGDKNFDTVKVKEGALEKIRDELRRKVKSGVIATGAMSDPYNPLEHTLKLTRRALELISAYEFGVAIATKSALIVRDADILGEIQAHSPVIVKMTITTADEDLCKKLEPNVSSTAERFEAMRKLSDQGVYCGALMMPILPFICDNEENITKILTQAKAAGARFCYPAFGMTLRQGNREYFYQQLDEQFPGMREKYTSKYGEDYGCPSPSARKLWGVFKEKCTELGLLYNMRDIISQYRAGYEKEQLRLF
ncbi:MAG: radical SAM protein [Oscillospiraceae bacterium]|nr:radical SAM protein [Oscillospiraceae bacterium]